VPLDLGVDSFASQTLQCMGTRDFATSILFYILTPVLLLLVVLAVCVASVVLERKQASAATVHAKLTAKRGQPLSPSRSVVLKFAPWMLLVCFLAFPVVSAKAFSTFSCESFDDGRSYLRVDYSVDCDSEEYSRAVAMAVIAILLFPVGIPLATGALLLRERSALRTEAETEWTRACIFLHRAFRPAFFWWELV
jgi:hypothetical protein